MGRAQVWRRQFDTIEPATMDAVAEADNLTDQFFSRTMPLPYPSREVLERLTVGNAGAEKRCRFAVAIVMHL